MDINKITVIDENNQELEFDILFTFENDETGKKYVLYYDAELEEPDVYASIYDEDGRLFQIETPEEWEMVDEFFNLFISEGDE